MLIGIDGNEANVATKVGISEYAFQLLTEFNKLSFNPELRTEGRITNDPSTSSGRSELQIYLKNNPREDLPKADEHWRYRIVKPKKLWTQIGLPLDLYTHFPRPNVFFTPSHYAPRFSPVPTVISIMDLSYIFFPDLFKKTDLYQLQNWTKYSAKNAKKILTISESTKRDIIRIYDIPQDRIVVTYPGMKKTYSGKVSAMDLLEKKYHISGDYILFVGTLQPRKNIEKLIEAFSHVSKKHPKVTLVVVGKRGWLYEEILKAPKKFGIEEKIKFVSFVPDEDLATFYTHAVCFVLPSLYEGFGLPVLEAMAYNCPVITSNISSLPEAGGDAALYVDPQSSDDIAEKIIRLIDSPKLRDELIEKGRKQIKKFSWEKTAKETLAVLEEVAIQK